MSNTDIRSPRIPDTDDMAKAVQRTCGRIPPLILLPRLWEPKPVEALFALSFFEFFLLVEAE